MKHSEMMSEIITDGVKISVMPTVEASSVPPAIFEKSSVGKVTIWPCPRKKVNRKILVDTRKVNSALATRLCISIGSVTRHNTCQRLAPKISSSRSLIAARGVPRSLSPKVTFFYGQMWKQRVTLKDHADIGVLNRLFGHVFSVERDRAADGADQPCDHAQRRSLDVARPAKQRHHFSGFDVQIDTLDFDECIELLANGIELNLSHMAFP